MEVSAEMRVSAIQDELPVKRARTESGERSGSPISVHSPVPPAGECMAGSDESPPHTKSGRGSLGGLSPDGAESPAAAFTELDARSTEADAEEDFLMVTPPPSAPAAGNRSPSALATPDHKVPSTALRVLASRTAAKPRVNKAVTTLHSLQQLETLLAPFALQSTRRVVQPAATLTPPAPLQLHAGETIMVLVHQGKDALATLLNEHTANMSMMRVFTLDIAALPPQEYEMGPRALSLSASCTSVTHAKMPHVDDRDEEETLIPVQPQSFNSYTSSLLDAIDADSLSNQLHHATDPVVERLARLFQVDTTICPWLSFGLDGGHHGGASTTTTQKASKDIFPLPAMIVWRAAGAPRDEYPPSPPQTYSSQPLASQPVQFPDRMLQQGGPLVVKEVHTVDQIHSLSLWQPVYTLPHLMRTALESIRAHPAHSTGDTSTGRSVIYLGASWCPPCMRIVGELPLLTAQGLPRTVHTFMKADMDFAKPIFDFFKVEIIPTFIVLDNSVLLECDRKLQGVADPAVHKEMIEAAFTKADLDHLQNSSRSAVTLFIEKNCTSLSFDEDF